MTFLNPAFLWLLPLISAPIIIHLLAKRKSKLIDFPSLKFLKLLEQDALRKFNVKQLVLLILRTLMILLIMLAFSRPSMNMDSGFKLGAGNINLMIIALDNTASNRGQIEQLSKSWMKELDLELEAKGFTVYYCGLSELKLYNSALEVEPAYAGIFANDLSQRFAEQIDLEQFNLKSILWVGDGQDARERLEELVGWDKYLHLMPLQNDNGLSHIKLPSQGVRLDEAYEVIVSVEHARNQPETMSLELMVNEKRQNLDVVQPDMATVAISARVEDGGYQSGRMILVPDEAAYNNERHFILPAEGAIPVQVIRSNLSPDFWKIIDTITEEQEMNLEIRLLEYSEIDNLNLSQGGTVIIDDASRLVAYNWNRLQTFIDGGGQVILFGDGGEKMRSMLRFRSALVPEENSFPLGLFLTREARSQLNSDPLNAAVSQNRLRVFKRYKTQGDELEQTWLRFLDDQPFLGAQNIGDGRLVWFNTDFAIGSNNLPLLGIFPTLMIELAQSQELKEQTDLYNSILGDTLYFYPPVEESGNSPYSVQRPDGTIDYLTPDSNYVIHYANADLPGIYKLTRGRKILQPMAVNVSSYEAQAHTREYSFSNTDIFVSEDETEVRSEILGKRSGTALWPSILILLFLIWIAETYLSRIKSDWRKDV